jgi:hypothetical protein
LSETIPVQVAHFDEMRDLSREGLDRIAALAKRILDDCGRWIPWLGPASTATTAALREFTTLVDRLVAETGRLIDHGGDPFALWEAGSRWMDELAPADAGRTGAVGGLGPSVGEQWEGPAAQVYRAMRPSQRAGLERAGRIAAETGVALQDAAVAIGAFWIATGAAVLNLAASLVSAVAAVTMAVTAPRGLALAIGAASTFVATMVALTTALAGLLTRVLDKRTKVHGRIPAGTPLPEPSTGYWPLPAVDRSTSDGNDRHLDS